MFITKEFGADNIFDQCKKEKIERPLVKQYAATCKHATYNN